MSSFNVHDELGSQQETEGRYQQIIHFVNKDSVFIESIFYFGMILMYTKNNMIYFL